MKISPEQARFIAMATDEDDTWDMTDQDKAALRWAMKRIESLQADLDAREIERGAVPHVGGKADGVPTRPRKSTSSKSGS